jgi:hypothetical protein
MPIRREGTLFALLLAAPVTSTDVETDPDAKAVDVARSVAAPASSLGFRTMAIGFKIGMLVSNPPGSLVFLTRPAAPPAGHFRAFPDDY